MSWACCRRLIERARRHCDYWGAIDHPVDDLRVGYTPDLDVYPVEEVEAVVAEVVEAFADAGSFVDPVSVSHALSINELVSTLMTGSTAFVNGHESFQTSEWDLTCATTPSRSVIVSWRCLMSARRRRCRMRPRRISSARSSSTLGKTRLRGAICW